MLRRLCLVLFFILSFSVLGAASGQDSVTFNNNILPPLGGLQQFVFMNDGLAGEQNNESLEVPGPAELWGPGEEVAAEFYYHSDIEGNGENSVQTVENSAQTIENNAQDDREKSYEKDNDNDGFCLVVYGSKRKTQGKEKSRNDGEMLKICQKSKQRKPKKQAQQQAPDAGSSSSSGAGVRSSSSSGAGGQFRIIVPLPPFLTGQEPRDVDRDREEFFLHNEWTPMSRYIGVRSDSDEEEYQEDISRALGAGF